MNTNQNQSSQKQAIIKAIKDICSLAEEQLMYQHILFEQINGMSCPAFDTFLIDKETTFKGSIQYASSYLDKKQAVEYIAGIVAERYENEMSRVAELAFLGERNRGYYVDRLYNEFRKLEELINSDE